uniref:Uncharacterized protein n=1 Tax=Pinguiococcus pyrenoidosus TaxID=172671 RepID=A0A7R9UGS9_9STRA|mmetsp:Transcript_9247/g.34711  ORF Transcript_9247/g.34711 Transcript_9247/m.34711 type:complete len:141 (+) Transcript_9247:42-464(+)|eukprot:scaffold1130_cov195-Pinguiococcus_pyrenoidosus.AAC.103
MALQILAIVLQVRLEESKTLQNAETARQTAHTLVRLPCILCLLAVPVLLASDVYDESAILSVWLDDLTAGGAYGSSVDVDGDVLVVGSRTANSGRGRVDLASPMIKALCASTSGTVGRIPSRSCRPSTGAKQRQTTSARF